MIIFHTDANNKKKKKRGRETSWLAQNDHDGHQCPAAREGSEGLKPREGT